MVQVFRMMITVLASLLAMVTVLVVPFHQALATDYVLIDNSSAPTLADNDTVSITGPIITRIHL